MTNFNLNAGGFLGALVCGGVVAAIIFTSADLSQTSRGPYRFVIAALIGGAFAGNFLWAWIFQKAERGSSWSAPGGSERGPPDDSDGPRRGKRSGDR